ncbi:hypothetical protein Ancab_014913 [Ancistrocladus abbreviatus]
MKQRRSTQRNSFPLVQFCSPLCNTSKNMQAPAPLMTVNDSMNMEACPPCIEISVAPRGEETGNKLADCHQKALESA